MWHHIVTCPAQGLVEQPFPRGLLRYASCALTSHYYFWDPAGSPALKTHPIAADLPEVGRRWEEARQSQQRASHKSHFLLFHEMLKAILAFFTLTCVVEPLQDDIPRFTLHLFAYNFLHQSNVISFCIGHLMTRFAKALSRFVAFFHQ